MLRNSFKFLSLALAASLIVAPVSAIDWNSNSSRFGLGLAIAGACWIVYNLCFGNTPKEKPVVTFAEKQRVYNILTSVNFINTNDKKFVTEITNRLGDIELVNLAQKLSEIREKLMQARQSNSYNGFLHNNKKDGELKKKELKNITHFQDLFDSKLYQIKQRLGTV